MWRRGGLPIKACRPPAYNANEEIPEGRLHIERLRRAGNKAASQGNLVDLHDLT